MLTYKAKCTFLVAIIGTLACVCTVTSQMALGDEATNYPNPINGVERWKIMEANIDKIVGMKREQVHKLFGGVDSLPDGVSNRQKEVIQLDSNVAAEIEFDHGFVKHPTFVKSEEANRFWPFGESNDYAQIAGPANTEDPRWPAMRDNLRNFMGMQRAKVEALLGPDREDPKSQEFGQHAVGNRSLWFWYQDGIVTRFDIDDLQRRSNMISFSCLRPPPKDHKKYHPSATAYPEKNANQNLVLTWNLVRPYLQRFVGMKREQIEAALGKAKFTTSRHGNEDTEGFDIEQDLVLQLLYRTGQVASYEFVRSQDARRFTLPADASGPHYEASLRASQGTCAQQLKRQEIFNSNLPELMGMRRAEILTLFGAPRNEPRLKSDLEFDCEQGILSFTFEQAKVKRFSFRPFDTAAAVHSPQPTVKH